MLLGKLVHINGTTKNMLVIVEGPSDADSLERNSNLGLCF